MLDDENNKISVPHTNFIIIESTILFDTRLNKTDAIVYGFISALSNGKNNCCNASNSYLEKLTRLKRRQLQYCLDRLEKYKYITITRAKNKRKIRTYVDNKIFERNIENGFIDYDWLNDNEDD